MEEVEKKDEVEKKSTKPKAKPKPKLIKMVRETDGKAADVHPSMVDCYISGGYKQV